MDLIDAIMQNPSNKYLITNFINKQIKDIEGGDLIIIKSLEEEDKFKQTITINNIPVLIKGKIDRIDEVNGTCRIIDYKSGAVNDDDLKGTTTEDDITKLKDKWLQLMVYAWLYSKKQNNCKSFEAGI